MEPAEPRRAIYVDLTRRQADQCAAIAERENRSLRAQLKQFIEEGIASREREPQVVAA